MNMKNTGFPFRNTERLYLYSILYQTYPVLTRQLCSPKANSLEILLFYEQKMSRGTQTYWIPLHQYHKIQCILINLSVK